MRPTLMDDFVLNRTDDESKFIQHIVQTYNDEVAIVAILKQLSIASAPGNVGPWLKDFVKRQPEVIAYMRSRIVFGTDPTTKKWVCNNQRYIESTRNCKESGHWHDWAADEYQKLAPIFNLPPPKSTYRWRDYHDKVSSNDS